MRAARSRARDERAPVDRVHDVGVARDRPGLVALQLPDEVPRARSVARPARRRRRPWPRPPGRGSPPRRRPRAAARRATSAAGKVLVTTIRVTSPGARPAAAQAARDPLPHRSQVRGELGRCVVRVGTGRHRCASPMLSLGPRSVTTPANRPVHAVPAVGEEVVALDACTRVPGRRPRLPACRAGSSDPGAQVQRGVRRARTPSASPARPRRPASRSCVAAPRSSAPHTAGPTTAETRPRARGRASPRRPPDDAGGQPARPACATADDAGGRRRPAARARSRRRARASARPGAGRHQRVGLRRAGPPAARPRRARRRRRAPGRRTPAGRARQPSAAGEPPRGWRRPRRVVADVVAEVEPVVRRPRLTPPCRSVDDAAATRAPTVDASTVADAVGPPSRARRRGAAGRDYFRKSGRRGRRRRRRSAPALARPTRRARGVRTTRSSPSPDATARSVTARAGGDCAGAAGPAAAPAGRGRAARSPSPLGGPLRRRARRRYGGPTGPPALRLLPVTAERAVVGRLVGTPPSKPAAMTVTRTSSPRASSMTAPKMMLASGCAASCDQAGGLVDLEQAEVRAARRSTAARRARRRCDASSSGLEIASSAACDARSSPRAEPMPIRALTRRPA